MHSFAHDIVSLFRNDKEHMVDLEGRGNLTIFDSHFCSSALPGLLVCKGKL